MTFDNDPLLSTPEVAAMLDVTPQTLEVWRSTKRYRLEFVKIGSKVRYRKSAVLQFIESRTVKL